MCASWQPWKTSRTTQSLKAADVVALLLPLAAAQPLLRPARLRLQSALKARRQVAAGAAVRPPRQADAAAAAVRHRWSAIIPAMAHTILSPGVSITTAARLG